MISQGSRTGLQAKPGAAALTGGTPRPLSRAQGSGGEGRVRKMKQVALVSGEVRSWKLGSL